LKQYDADLKLRYADLVVRYFALFESIINFYRDLIRLTSDLDGGIFVQESIEVGSSYL